MDISYGHPWVWSDFSLPQVHHRDVAKLMQIIQLKISSSPQTMAPFTSLNCRWNWKPSLYTSCAAAVAALPFSNTTSLGLYYFPDTSPAAGFCRGPTANVKAFASKNQVKKSRKQGKSRKDDVSFPPINPLIDDPDGLSDDLASIRDDYVQDTSKTSTDMVPSRGAVLQACIVTSCVIGSLGVIIRQISHSLHQEGVPVIDCSTQIPFTFEIWHFELIGGIVVLISSCRYLLLKTWPNFAESSEAANRQVLTSLEPLDYMVVAFLPGISEELLFRGALLPIFGMDWKSVIAVAALFGVLHLGSGRKYSFAVWATFVGVVYGYGTVSSSSLVVPMASHAINNLVGAIIWRYKSSLSK